MLNQIVFITKNKKYLSNNNKYYFYIYMNKKDIMKYYIKDWIPHIDNFFRFFFQKKVK